MFLTALPLLQSNLRTDGGTGLCAHAHRNHPGAEDFVRKRCIECGIKTARYGDPVGVPGGGIMRWCPDCGFKLGKVSLGYK